MSRIPDLVRDSKLETRFHSGYTSHVYYESDPTSRQRAVQRQEYWKREKFIGGGGFGSVWLERCVKGQREVEVRAVKHIPRSLKAIDYNRELEAIAKFSHPKYERCFVKSFGWYERAEAMCIAMEYFPLGDLQSYLISAPPLPELEAQQITFQILEGLSFMHENGFAHRDLKPSNILVKSKPPEEWWVKIGDFGISKRAEDGVGVSSTLKGTLGFMAPELHGFFPPGREPAPPSPHAADMWSLGEMAFRMLTKQTAFKDLSVLFAFIQNKQDFPLASLQAHKASEAALQFIQATMMAVPETRLKAQQALHHKWMEPFIPPSPRPPSIASIGSLVLQDISEALPSEVLAEPSGGWSTVAITAEQQHFSTNIDSGGREPQVIGSMSTQDNGSKSPHSIQEASSALCNSSRYNSALEPQSPGLEAADYGAAEKTVTPRIAYQRQQQEKEGVLGVTEYGSLFFRVLEGHLDFVRAVAFSPDGKLVASGSYDGTVRLWDSATGAPRSTLKGHSDYVCAVAFSPDGKLVASGSGDYTVRLWDSATGAPRGTLKGHSDYVCAVAFSPDGKLVASGSADNTVRLWDLTTWD